MPGLAFARRLAMTALLAWLVLLVGCASLPSAVERPPSTTRIAPPDAPLAAMAAALATPRGQSALRPLIFPDLALDARLDLMRRAQVSLDLQSYMIGNDGIGRMLLRELRNVAARGVRVRLLIDDLYAQGMDDPLLGLAAHDGIEVRTFNPFAYGRDASLPRLWHLRDRRLAEPRLRRVLEQRACVPAARRCRQCNERDRAPRAVRAHDRGPSGTTGQAWARAAGA